MATTASEREDLGDRFEDTAALAGMFFPPVAAARHARNAGAARDQSFMGPTRGAVARAHTQPVRGVGLLFQLTVDGVERAVSEATLAQDPALRAALRDTSSGQIVVLGRRAHALGARTFDALPVLTARLHTVLGGLSRVGSSARVPVPGAGEFLQFAHVAGAIAVSRVEADRTARLIAVYEADHFRAHALAACGRLEALLNGAPRVAAAHVTRR